MNESILVAIITLGGSGLGSLCGIVISSRLTTYRLAQLEKKVDKHNCIIERTYKLEARADVAETNQKVTNHRIEDLEKEK